MCLDCPVFFGLSSYSTEDTGLMCLDCRIFFGLSSYRTENKVPQLKTVTARCLNEHEVNLSTLEVLFLSSLNKIRKSPQILVKPANMNFHENLSVRNRAISCWRTDMTRLTIFFATALRTRLIIPSLNLASLYQHTIHSIFRRVLVIATFRQAMREVSTIITCWQTAAAGLRPPEPLALTTSNVHLYVNQSRTKADT